MSSALHHASIIASRAAAVARRSSLRSYASQQRSPLFGSSDPPGIPRKGDKVVIAMSGGVDSSVAAALLAQQDFDLSAVFMRNWDTRDELGDSDRGGCEWEKDWEDVRLVCRQLDIPTTMVDLSREYWHQVWEPALATWNEGGTPNPDVHCNKEIKFGALMDRALPSPSAWIATGHYARIQWTSSAPHSPARPQLHRAADSSKDQSYYLSSVAESRFRRTVFPLGDLHKRSVRSLAHTLKLPTASRAESMGVCFIGEKGKFGDWLSDYVPPRQGNLVAPDGRVMGKHTGLHKYTVGQGAKIQSQKERWFVAAKRYETNEVVIVPSTDNPALYCSSLIARDWTWIWDDHPPAAVDSPGGLAVRCQVRHRQAETDCIVRRNPDKTYTVSFPKPEKAVAPGQIVAIWDGPWCLGSGTIDSTDALA